MPLFDRQAPVVTPTLYGEALLRRAAAILDDADELEREIALLQGLDDGKLCRRLGGLRGGAVRQPGRWRADPAAPEPALPGQAEQLASGGRSGHRSEPSILGFAEISTLRDVERLQIEPIGQHAVVFYCRRGHPLLARRRCRRPTSMPSPWCRSASLPAGRVCFPGKGDLDADTGDLIPHVEVNDLATAHAIVRASDAFGVATPLQIEPWLRSGELGRPALPGALAEAGLRIHLSEQPHAVARRGAVHGDRPGDRGRSGAPQPRADRRHLFRLEGRGLRDLTERQVWKGMSPALGKLGRPLMLRVASWSRAPSGDHERTH